MKKVSRNIGNALLAVLVIAAFTGLLFLVSYLFFSATGMMPYTSSDPRFVIGPVGIWQRFVNNLPWVFAAALIWLVWQAWKWWCSRNYNRPILTISIALLGILCLVVTLVLVWRWSPSRTTTHQKRSSSKPTVDIEAKHKKLYEALASHVIVLNAESVSDLQLKTENNKYKNLNQSERDLVKKILLAYVTAGESAADDLESWLNNSEIFKFSLKTRKRYRNYAELYPGEGSQVILDATINLLDKIEKDCGDSKSISSPIRDAVLGLLKFYREDVRERYESILK